MYGKHFKNYIEIVGKSSPESVESIKQTVDKIVPEYIEPFSHQEHIKGLLLGQVQSGKTGQVLGLVAASADTDEGFATFILLTSDITALQQQTYRRALAAMDTFNVCGEHDELRFNEIGARKPSLIILKKNSRILRKWRNILSASGIPPGRPIFIIDDEADAASLNTLVNRREQSAINTHLHAIINAFTSSFYLQVTATPQALFLQSDESGWRPSFVHYFAPGHNYLGGEFFYSKPKPFTNITTNDNELDILLNDGEIAEGLKMAIETYMVTFSDIMLDGAPTVCNFLVHPSVRIEHHEKIKDKVVEYINYLFEHLNDTHIQTRLKYAWDNLQKSKPHLKDFPEVLSYLLGRPEISVITMNSGPDGNSRIAIDSGLNIVIGGNSLGRGVTFKRLQTVYYCRSARSPQADTFWQHCRMFGYDRDPSLMRVFMPLPLFNLFSEINASNEMLLKQIQENGLDKIQIVTDRRLRPTRRNVIDQEKYEVLVGGVNYFPPSPDQTNVEILDKVLKSFDHSKAVYDISTNDAISIIGHIKDDPSTNWTMAAYKNALLALKGQKNSPDIVKLVVRRDRDIGRGTGTMLSEDDRRLGSDIQSLPVLTLYRINGQKSKGWDGNPFWMPNVKLPIGKVFHRVD